MIIFRETAKCIMKNNLIFLAFFGLATAAYAQQNDSLIISQRVDSLIKVARNLTGYQKFDKALTVNQSAETLALEKMGPESAEYGKACFNHGRVFDKQKSFPEAIIWYKKAIAIQEKLTGEAHLDCAYSLANLGSVYNDSGWYYRSEPLYLESMNIISDILGKEHPHYGLLLNNLAQNYKVTREYDKAEPLFLEAIRIRKNGLGEESFEYGNSVKNLADLYYEMGAYRKAEPLFAESKSIFAKTVGLKSPEYAGLLGQLGLLYMQMAEFDESEQLLLEARSILEKNLFQNFQDYVWVSVNLAGLYFTKGDYKQAEKYGLEAKGLYEKAAGKGSSAYAAGILNLASMYFLVGEYAKAEEILLESKDILSKAKEGNLVDYTTAVINLGDVYVSSGEYAKAEPLFLEARELMATFLPKEHPDYGVLLLNLSDLYLFMGNYAKAEPLFLETKEIWEKSLGTEHPNYALALINLGSVYTVTGNYSTAEPMFFEARDIIGKSLGKKHPTYAIVLAGLGELYLLEENYTKAEPFFIDAIDIWESASGRDPLNYTASLTNLATLYFQSGKFDKAEVAFEKAKERFEALLGTEHPNYSKLLINQAMLYQNTDNKEKASDCLYEAIVNDRVLIDVYSAYFSEAQMAAFLKTIEPNTERFQSYVHQNPDPRLICAEYNNALFYNGFLLEKRIQLSRAIANAGTEIQDVYEKWQSCNRRLAKRYSRPIAERVKIAKTQDEADKYEKQLLQELAAFKSKSPRWEDIQKKLGPKDAAIEFIHYTLLKAGETNSDKVAYSAMILRPGMDAPQFVPLFEEAALDSMLLVPGVRDASYVSSTNQVANRGVVPTAKTQKALYEHETPYELVWKPMEKALLGVEKVYYSPTGLLHRINLSAIPVTYDSVLADRYQLVRLGSTRQLVNSDKIDLIKNDLVAFGGIQYDMDSTALVTDIKKLENPEFATRGQSNPENQGSWGFLAWTEREVDAIGAVAKTASFETEIRTNFQASEEAFKSYARSLDDRTKSSPKVLHLATHGYFSPDPKDSLKLRIAIDQGAVGFINNDNPLMRSGLLLAGANYSWVSGKPLVKGMDNGILTAYEISHLDLSNTELVVLSACETGLGDIEGNEGVYGLQRAFKIAGVRYLIMSLWRVEDKATSVLMTRFYKNWLEKNMEIPEAFRTAQKELRELGQSPYQWAGFVLME